VPTLPHLSTWRSPQPFNEAQRQRLTLLAMCAATFIIQVDVTIVNVALPSIQRSLHTTPGELEWRGARARLFVGRLFPHLVVALRRRIRTPASWRSDARFRRLAVAPDREPCLF
jgi:hypothetical protein